MARYFKTLLFSFLILSFTSCQEGGEAGDLLGMWHVKRLSSTYGGYGSYNSGLTRWCSTPMPRSLAATDSPTTR